MCTINENVCCCSTGAASVPPKAHLMISPAVIRESDTLQMTCEVPQSQSASLCVFYLDGIEAAPYSHPSCQISLTGVQLLQWTRQSSPLEAKVGCYYTVTSPGQQIQQSAHSDLVSVTVLGEHPHSLVLIYQLMFQYVTTDDIYSCSCYMCISERFVS